MEKKAGFCFSLLNQQQTVLEVKYFIGKCRGCKRTLTGAVAPSLRNCLCAQAQVPWLRAMGKQGCGVGGHLLRGHWFKRSCGSSVHRGPHQPKSQQPPHQAESPVRQPPLPPHQELKQEPAVTGNACLRACLLVQKCCDLLMETSGTREENGSISKIPKQTAAKRITEFKYRERSVP